MKFPLKMSKTKFNSKQIDFGDVLYIKIKNNVFYSTGFYDPIVTLISGGEDELKKISFKNCLFRIIPYLLKPHERQESSAKTAKSAKSNKTFA